ncbi:hypothetical protein MTO96_045262 [Rhipicephalus appendiculatus]
MANCEDAQYRSKCIYDRTHRPRTFRVCDFVWIRRQQPVLQGLGKLSPRFKGIYQLVQRLTPNTFKAIPASSASTRQPAQLRTVHVSQLKHHVPPSPAKGPGDVTTMSSLTSDDSLSCSQPYEPASLPQPASGSCLESRCADPLPLNDRRPVQQRRLPAHLQDYEVELR